MATNFPTSLDALTNPTSSNKLSDAGVLHADQHANANDAIEALEAKVGVNSSAVTTSLEYRVAQLEKTFTTLANGTLALALAANRNVRVTPTATGSFTTTVPASGVRCNLIVLTSGATSYTMTFGTGFKTTGTLATGVATARYFVFDFISDGTSLIEVSRTIAMA
jgi:hypothetical protein